MKFYTLTALVLFTAFFKLNAQNDTTQTKDIFDITLEELMNLEVSGVSRYKQSTSDVPNSIQVISRQQIQDRAYQDLSDLLKDVAGFDITANAGQFGEFYSLRGIGGNDRFLVLINGQKLNPSSGTHLSIGNSISIKYADRVEIIYGPASAVYGADAFSGIINIVMNEDVPEKRLTVSAQGNYGSLNTTDASFEMSLKPTNKLSFYLNSRIYKSDGPDFSEQENSFYDYASVQNYPSPLTNRFEQPTDDHNIYFSAKYKNLSINYYRQQFDEGNALGFIPDIYIYNQENKWKTSTDIIWLTYKKELKNGGIINYNLSGKNHIQDKNTIYYKWNVPGVFDADETYKQYMTGKDKTLHGVLTYNKTIKKTQFIIGMDNEFSSEIPPYANDEVLGQSDKYEGENAILIDDALTITENRLSGFGQLVYSPSAFINVTLGARYDYSTRYGSTVNPRAGLIISPAESTKLKFNYGRAFQAPSLFFEYEQWGAPNIVNISASEMQKIDPSWQLENQIVNSYEISLNQKITKNLNITSAVYYNDLTNLIVRNYFTDSIYNKYFDTYTAGLRNENIGQEEIIGGNFSVNAKISHNIVLYSYYTYTDAVSINNESTETDIPRISTHKVWAGFTLQNIFGMLSISPRIKWVGDMYNANTEVFPDHNQDGYYTADVSLVLNNIKNRFRLYADFKNITNQKIEAGGLYEQTGVYTATIPQDEFSFKIGFEYFLNKN